MEVPLDIFRKSKKKRIELPDKLFVNNYEEIPDHVVIKYKDYINVDKLHQILQHKYDVLKKKELDVSTYQVYFDESAYLIKTYNETKDKNSLQKYLDLCNKYIKIECIREVDYSIRCKGCNKVLDNDEENEDNIFICSICECINTFLKPNTYIRLSDNGSTEDDTNNFIKVLDKFEGRNEPHPPEEIYVQLDNYFTSMKMEKGEYYRNLPLNQSGKKEGTSKKKLWDALENTGNNKYYDESNFIAHKYWGWKLPDISLYREKLISDYQETQNIWNKIKYKYNRSASLGTQFRLYVHLKAINYPCDREDFKIQDMVESLRIHNDAWKIMCDETDLKYIFVS